MALINISEKEQNSNNLLYIQKNLCELFRQTSSKFSVSIFAKRAVLSVNVNDYYETLVKNEIAGCVSEVLTVFYKYEFLKKRLFTAGLSKEDNDILMSSIIACDYYQDFDYILKKIGEFDDIAIDGIYNFKLKALKEKWQEITEVFPPSFTKLELKDFVGYIQKGLKNKIFIEDGKVYDEHFKRLNRSELIGNEFSVIKEAILSNAGKIELLSNGDIPFENDLKLYYGDRVTFNKKV